jgi:hypothetical protein
MNELIRELADQARFVKTTDYPNQDEIFEKFAELIVQECINIVDMLPNGYKDYRNTIENEFREDCINTMKKHFGVEE